MSVGCNPATILSSNFFRKLNEIELDNDYKIVWKDLHHKKMDFKYYIITKSI